MAAFLTDQKRPMNNLRTGFCTPLQGRRGVVSHPLGPAPGAAELAENGTDEVFALVILNCLREGTDTKQADTQHHNRITNSDGPLEGQDGVVEKTGGLLWMGWSPRHAGPDSHHPARDSLPALLSVPSWVSRNWVRWERLHC